VHQLGFKCLELWCGIYRLLSHVLKLKNQD
jgi:hypothetical protein